MKTSSYELEIVELKKRIDKAPVLSGISLQVKKGECLCLLGPSGCGKTTLLRLVAGLDSPESGDIRFRGKSILTTPAHRRNFTMMFQDFALFPHRDVFSNISFGLEMKQWTRQRMITKVDQMLELVGLSGFGHRSIDELSGGERQRVALARALAPEPDCILLDEPLGSLDRILKERLLEDIMHILKQVETTAIFVTHDQAEAFYAADRICLLNQGRVEQVDTPTSLYYFPKTLYAARFLGFKNKIPYRYLSDHHIDTCIGRFVQNESPGHQRQEMVPGSKGELIILPDAAMNVTESEGFVDENAGPVNRIFGIVRQVSFKDGYHQVEVIPQCRDKQDARSCDDLILWFNLPKESRGLVPGTEIRLQVDPSGLRLFQEKRQQIPLGVNDV